MLEEFKKPQNWESFAESHKHTKLKALDQQFYGLAKLDKVRAGYIRKSWQDIQKYFPSR